MKRPIEDINEAILYVFSKSAIAEDEYGPLAAKMVEEIQIRLGGRTTYIHTPSLINRNRKIMYLWRQRVPQKEIASEFNISESAVSKIINSILRESRRQKNNGFGSADWSF